MTRWLGPTSAASAERFASYPPGPDAYCEACRRPLDAQERIGAAAHGWMREQLALPQALFTVSELSILSGLPMQRVRRYLDSKKLIERAEGVRGDAHEVALDRLMQMAPEFWHAIRFRVSKYVGEEIDPERSASGNDRGRPIA